MWVEAGSSSWLNFCILIFDHIKNLSLDFDLKKTLDLAPDSMNTAAKATSVHLTIVTLKGMVP